MRDFHDFQDGIQLLRGFFFLVQRNTLKFCADKRMQHIDLSGHRGDIRFIQNTAVMPFKEIPQSSNAVEI